MPMSKKVQWFLREPHCGLTSPVHHVLNLFSLQLLLVLIVPTHNGMARLK